MRRADPRNRRSQSSTSMYNQHSSSLIMLESYEANHIKPNKTDQKYADIEQSCILPIYSELKKYETDVSRLENGKLFEWRSQIKTFLRKLRVLSKNQQDHIAMLKNNLSQLQQAKATQLRALHQKYEQEIQSIKNGQNRQLMQITTEFNKKQYSYKEVIQKFVGTLQQSQRVWSGMQGQLINKFKLIQNVVKQKKCMQGKYKQVCDEIEMIIGGIGPKDKNDSLQSINLSDDEDVVNSLRHKQIQVFANQGQQIQDVDEVKRNMIDMSSIEQIELDAEDPEEELDTEEGYNHRDFECCLVRLISEGFFKQKNKGAIKRIRSITKDMQEPQNITNEPIFQIILESIRLNLELDKDPSLMEINHNFQIQDHNDQKKLIIRSMGAQM